jgi:glycosyltransferase 2 family protein
MKKILGYVLRFGVSIGLLVYLASRMNFHDTPTQQGFLTILSNVDLRWFIPGFLILFGHVWLFTIRWRLLLKHQCIDLPFWQVFRMVYIGAFLNCVLPGAVTGDVVKSAIVCKQTNGLAKPIMSVLIDRLVGFICLMVICVVGLLVVHNPNPQFMLIKKLCLIGSGAFLAFVIFLILFSRSAFIGRIKFFNTGMVGNVREAFIVYHNEGPDILKAFGLSVLVHLIMIANNIMFAKALGINVPLWYFLVLVPLADLVVLLPLSIGGWGIGEGGYALLLGFWNVPLASGIALSALYRISNTLWYLPGAFFMLYHPKPKNSPQCQPDAQTPVAPAKNDGVR